MGLILRVRKLGVKGSQSPDERHVNDARFRIGRDKEKNDLVLDDGEVSRSHAYVEKHGDTYELVDVSRNGVRVNGVRIPSNKPQPLRDGDRIQIEDYEITALIDAMRLRSQAVKGAGLASPSVEPSGRYRSNDRRPDDALGTSRKADLVPDVPLEPFREATNQNVFFGAKSAPIVGDDDEFDALYNNASSMQDQFQPPKVIQDPGMPAKDDDSDLFASFNANAAASSEVTREERAPSPIGDPDPPISHTPEIASTPRVPPPTRLEIAQSGVGAEPEKFEPTDVRQQSASVAALLQGMGVDPSTPVDDEVLREIGVSFSILLAAIIDLVSTRAQVKRQLGLESTLLQASGNNPIKISPNVHDALDQLFFRPRRGFLAGAEAAQETVADLTTHEMAILSGIQVLSRELPSHVDPKRLETQFDDQIKRLGLLAGLVKSKYWELYKEFYADKIVDTNFVVRVFARAYEDALRELDRSTSR